MHIKTKNYKIFDKDTLLMAKLGERSAVEMLIKHYEPYINKLCTIKVVDYNNEERYSFTDEDLKQTMCISILRALDAFKI